MTTLWLLLLAATPALPHVECSRGPSSALKLGTQAPTIAMHDGPEPRSELEVVDLAGRSLAFYALDGAARCLGFIAPRAAHLVSLEREVGAIVPVVALLLLSEDGKLTPIHLADDEVLALALVVDVPGARVALVASRRGRPYRVFLVDLMDGSLKELGEPPAPPPRGEPFKGRWAWSIEEIGRVVDMEPTVLGFAADGLHASYGADTAMRRGAQRRGKVWKLVRR